MPVLPQVPGHAPTFGLKRGPPHQQGDGDEGLVVEDVDEIVANGALEGGAQVPAVEHERVDRDRHRRLAQQAEGCTQAAAPGQ